MTKILVPLDFSEASKNALNYALNLFSSTSIEITLLHVYGAHSTALVMKSIDRVLIKDAKAKLKEVTEDISAKAPNAKVKTVLAKEYAVSSISELADSGNYDFIVMGTKGVSGLKEVFIGSVAGGVISKTEAPVIVVPEDYNYQPFKKIIFALGNVEINNEKTIQPLKTLTQIEHVELEVLHITKEGESDLKADLDILKDLNPNYTNKSSEGDINKDISNYANSEHADLLCLLRTKRDFFHRLFSGSVTSKQTFDCSIPLLILHN